MEIQATLEPSERMRTRAIALRAGTLCVLAALLLALLPASAAAGLGPYFSASLHVKRNSYTFGQTPAWTSTGAVLSNESDRTGTEQVYISHLNGSAIRCLTCGRLPGPNGFPEQQPGGRWILFCSMGAQPQSFGGPCLGGYGSDLYVMRPDGTHVTRLTASSDPAEGARYNTPGGIPYDNYHPYWSPDGRHLVWTRTEAFPLSAGGQRWEILLADFVDPSHGRPHLAHVRVVGPAFGVYETQAWAPDGSGFLFTSFGPRRSPFNPKPPGWMHLELYFMRLFGRGASLAHPRVTPLTGIDPAYYEQAIFTPDMREVIVMSSRARPGTWYQTVITAAQWLGFDAPDAGSAGTPMFLADFSDPNFTSDLFMVDLATGAVRQLTAFHHVIPEFGWNSNYTRLIWTEVVGIPGKRVRHITRTASFAGVTAAQRRIPRSTPPALLGAAIDMARVAGAIRPVRAGVTPRVGSRQVGSAGARAQAGIPPVVVSYGLLLLGQLNDLANLAKLRIGQPSF
jgi:WD40-like Beta Propeller Repeat